MNLSLPYTGALVKEVGNYGLPTRRRVRQEALAVAESAGRPVIHLQSPAVNKEEVALRVAAENRVKEGIIAAITAVESCPGYDVRSDRDKGLLELYHRPRKCQHVYIYRIHPTFRLMYSRLATWFPFNIHIGINGREWLSRQMRAVGIEYLRRDNCFVRVGDVARVQQLLDEQVSFDWEKSLGDLGRQINPALRSIVGDYNISYYWSIDQSEWATDVLFKRREDLERLYPALLRQGMESFRPPEGCGFRGSLPRRGGLRGKFAGEVFTDLRGRRRGVGLSYG